MVDWPASTLSATKSNLPALVFTGHLLYADAAEHTCILTNTQIRIHFSSVTF